PVADVAEVDRLRRAHGLTRGDHLAVADAPTFLVRLDVRVFHALDAIGAFFHHATPAHRDFRIALGFQGVGGLVGVLQEIEAAHFVRTIVGAEARTHAAVVNLQVEAYAVVHGGTDRAHHFARRVFAHHARHRLRVTAWVVHAAVEITVDPDPVHLAATLHLILADHRYVVFRLARHGARVAADARIEIYAHSPGVLAGRVVLVQAGWRVRIAIPCRGEPGIMQILVQRAHAQQVTALHVEMMLGAGKRVSFAGLAQPQSARVPWSRRGAQTVSIESLPITDMPCGTTAISQVQRHAALGLTRHDPDRYLQLAAVQLQLDHVTVRKRLAF